jgi:hypothetical protein
MRPSIDRVSKMEKELFSNAIVIGHDIINQGENTRIFSAKITNHSAATNPTRE